MTDALAIQATGLEKSYKSHRVVAGVDLAVATGSVFALLGPNGAGKTTTVRMLATLTAPDGGSARVAGCDVVAQRAQARRRISLTGQQVALDVLQTGAENLAMIARLLGCGARASRTRAAELLARFGLSDAADRRVATYSGGMRRRLDLAASLVGRPTVLFLDEPTTGLDPRSRLELWGLVGELTAGGTTVLLTTQYLEEADRLADAIAVLDQGRIVASGTAAKLKAIVGERRLELRCADRAAFDAVARRAGDALVLREPGALRLALPCGDGAPELRALLDRLDPDGSAIAEFSVRAADLDDAFLTLTGHAPTTDQSD